MAADFLALSIVPTTPSPATQSAIRTPSASEIVRPTKRSSQVPFLYKMDAFRVAAYALERAKEEPRTHSQEKNQYRDPRGGPVNSVPRWAPNPQHASTSSVSSTPSQKTPLNTATTIATTLDHAPTEDPRASSSKTAIDSSQGHPRAEARATSLQAITPASAQHALLPPLQHPRPSSIAPSRNRGGGSPIVRANIHTAPGVYDPAHERTHVPHGPAWDTTPDHCQFRPQGQTNFYKLAKIVPPLFSIKASVETALFISKKRLVSHAFDDVDD
ncbi:hypothetical protein FRC02_008590 [Tulasnella sp. 418]|nr:hypothetical protein FRC02_008590 [Tulasnella sp. 418]